MLLVVACVGTSIYIFWGSTSHKGDTLLSRKLNTTQHTAREAKKQRQGQLQAGIAMALGGEAAAAIATGL